MARPDASAAVSVGRFFEFALLGLVVSGFLALAGSGYLDVTALVLGAAGLVLRVLAVGGVMNCDLSDRGIAVITLAYGGFFLLDYLAISHELLPAAIHLAIFLAAIKILTAKTNRDHLFTGVIAVLELLGAAFLSINLNFFLCLALYLLFAMAALTSGEIRRSMEGATTTARASSKRFHPRLAMLTALITLGILALTGGLFFVLPRTGAAVAGLISHRIFIPGFSNQVMLGEIGEIKTSSQPVMHIQIFGHAPAGGLKWRGGVLADFDGRRWSNPNPNRERVTNAFAPESSEYQQSGRHIGYRVEMENVDSDALFFAGIPEQVSLLNMHRALLYRTESGCFRLGGAPFQGFQYEAHSLLPDPPEGSPVVLYPGHVLPLAQRTRYMQLPPLDPRIPELAREMAGPSPGDLERARGVERRLRSDYSYTLDLPSRETADPLANFLFTRKKGHCEYFASAMTVLLRTLGIPSRMVTGFQSGVYNPITDQWLIRASDAHAWVEAWIPGHGWSTFDPTPPDLNPPSFAILSKIRLYLDAAETYWHQWVVGYDPGRQGALADQIEQGASRASIRWLDALLGGRANWDVYMAEWWRRSGVFALWIALLAGWIWILGPRVFRMLRVRRRVQRVLRGQASAADATLLYERMLHLLKRRGYQKPAWFTPAEFANSLPLEPLGTAVLQFTDTYNAVRFGGRTAVAPRLSILLEELERQERTRHPAGRFRRAGPRS